MPGWPWSASCRMHVNKNRRWYRGDSGEKSAVTGQRRGVKPRQPIDVLGEVLIRPGEEKDLGGNSGRKETMRTLFKGMHHSCPARAYPSRLEEFSDVIHREQLGPQASMGPLCTGRLANCSFRFAAMAGRPVDTEFDPLGFDSQCCCPGSQAGNRVRWPDDCDGKGPRRGRQACRGLPGGSANQLLP